MEPCGTPQVTLDTSEVTPLTLTLCVRLERYDDIQSLLSLEFHNGEVYLLKQAKVKWSPES